MKAFQIGDVLVLGFDDTDEARMTGDNLSKMLEGCRYYATAPEGTPESVIDSAITSLMSSENVVSRVANATIAKMTQRELNSFQSCPVCKSPDTEINFKTKTWNCRYCGHDWKASDSDIRRYKRAFEEDMSKERVSSLFVKLQTWATRKVVSLPASAPVAAQITESLFKLERAVMKPGVAQLTGEDGVRAFVCAAIKSGFTLDAPPLPTLRRKYGDFVIRKMAMGCV